MSGDNSGDNVWILGAYMTKFGRHNDKDLIDLASESALGAMKDDILDRYERLSGMPTDVCPEGKLTRAHQNRELATDAL